jgi:hypothetical protein
MMCLHRLDSFLAACTAFFVVAPRRVGTAFCPAPVGNLRRIAVCCANPIGAQHLIFIFACACRHVAADRLMKQTERQFQLVVQAKGIMKRRRHLPS